MSRRLALALIATLFAAVPAVRAYDNVIRRQRQTFQRDRIDPRRQARVRTRITEFQPVKDFVPQPITVPVPRRTAFFRVQKRRTTVSRIGADLALPGALQSGALRYSGNRVQRARRASLRRRR